MVLASFVNRALSQEDNEALRGRPRKKMLRTEPEPAPPDPGKKTFIHRTHFS
jgi:hypothetical protein